MAAYEVSQDPNGSWLEALNKHYCNSPDSTAEALAFIATMHEETTGPFLSVDKKD